MSVLLDLIVGNLTPIIAVVGAVLGLFGINFYGKRQARKEAWREAETADLRRALNRKRKADEISDAISGRSDDDRERMRKNSPARRD